MRMQTYAVGQLFITTMDFSIIQRSNCTPRLLNTLNPSLSEFCNVKLRQEFNPGTYYNI